MDELAEHADLKFISKIDLEKRSIKYELLNQNP